MCGRYSLPVSYMYRFGFMPLYYHSRKPVLEKAFQIIFITDEQSSLDRIIESNVRKVK